MCETVQPRERITSVKMFTFDNSSVSSKFPLETLLPAAELGPDLAWLLEFEEVGRREAKKIYFLPQLHSSRVKRSHCQGSGLGIFNFLLFLAVLLGLLSTLLNNAMLNIMINGQSVSLFQVNINKQTVSINRRGGWERQPFLSRGTPIRLKLTDKQSYRGTASFLFLFQALLLAFLGGGFGNNVVNVNNNNNNK